MCERRVDGEDERKGRVKEDGKQRREEKGEKGIKSKQLVICGFDISKANLI